MLALNVADEIKIICGKVKRKRIMRQEDGTTINVSHNKSLA